jgi:hypothetical protein
MNLTLEEQKELLEKRHEYTMTEQTNEFSMSFAKTTITSAFVLNGAAATALLYAGVKELYPVIKVFGLGALLAVVTAVLAYLFTLVLLESWRHTRPEDLKKAYLPVYVPFIWDKDITYRAFERLRFIPILCLAFSIGTFLYGLDDVATILLT